MKKIISVLSILSLLAVLSSCDGKKVYVDESASTAPVLSNGVASASGISCDYTPGELNVNNAFAKHTLAIVKLNGKEVSQVVTTKATDTKLSATAKDISKALVALGCAVGDEVSFEAAARITLNPALNYGGVDSQDHIVAESFVVIPFTEAGLEYFSDYSSFTGTSTWAVVGRIESTGNDWGNDEPMICNDEHWHVCVGLELKTSDQFKFRKDGGWAVNIGAEGSTEPFVVDLGTEYNGAGGGKNLAVPEDGVYDLLIYTEDDDPDAAKYKIVKHIANPYEGWATSAEWGVIGKITSTENDWGKDEPMISNGTWWCCRNLELAASDQFKFRKDGGWAVNVGADGSVEPFVVSLKTPTTGVANGKNLAVEADGVYDLLLNPETSVFIVVVAGTVPGVDVNATGE